MEINVALERRTNLQQVQSPIKSFFKLTLNSPMRAVRKTHAFAVNYRYKAITELESYLKVNKTFRPSDTSQREMKKTKFKPPGFLNVFRND